MKLLFPDIGKQKDKAYLEENGDGILAAVTDDDSELLTLRAASPPSWQSLPQDRRRSFLARGLAEEDREGNAAVSPLGLRAVSYAAIFGREGCIGSYPFQFLPMMMSILASGTISEKPSSAEKYLSSALFTSRFPSIDPEKATRAAAAIMKALLYLGVAEADSDGMVYLSQDAATRFSKLGTVDAIGYLIHPEYFDSRRRHLVEALCFLSLARGGDEGRILRFISDATGYCLADDLDALGDLFFIERDGGRLHARSLSDTGDPLFSVSSDFTISVSGKCPPMLFSYADPLSLGEHVSQWAITRQSAKTAFSLGATCTDVERMIAEAATYPVSDTVFMRLRSWYESFNSLKAARGVVLAADERSARIIDSMSTLQVHILGKLGSSIYLMDPATERMWRRMLSNEGFDMLARTKGPRFLVEDEEIRSFEENARETGLPAERGVPYDSVLMERLLKEADTPLKAAYVRSGLIWREGMEAPDVSSANGLYYQEKLALITAAAAKGGKVLAEMLDGDAYIGHPQKSAEGDEAYVDIEGICRLPIARIWKVYAVDSAIVSGKVRSADGCRSDSDSQ